jgi:hypothetical protein
MSQNSKSAFRRKTSSRKARFEALEDRRLLTVTVKAANNNIFISGDSNGNKLAVFQDAGGSLFIYGDENTTIAGDGVVSATIPDTNPGGGRVFNSGLFRNIFINMGSGSDVVQIAGLRAADVDILDINTGDATGGSDTVSFLQTTFVGSPDTAWGASATSKAVSITTGSGDDYVNVSALTAAGLSIDTGAGNDTIGVAQNDDVAIHGDLSIVAGDGGGTVNVAPNSHTLVVDGSMNVQGGAGNDFYTFDGLTVGNVVGSLNIQTGAGEDQVAIGGNSAVSVSHGSLSIDVGDSATGNAVRIGANAAVTVSGNTTITAGSGNTLASNLINVDNLTTSALSINGGANGDSINLAASHNVVVHGDLAVNAGSGANFITVGTSTISLTVDGNVNIIAGSGNDEVTLDNLTVGNVLGDLTIQTGAGDDNIQLGSTVAVSISHGSLSIDAGNATIGNGIAIGLGAAVTVSGNTSLTSGSSGASNGIAVNNLTTSALSINTGSAADNINVALNSAVTVHGDFTVNAGAGDNHVVMGTSATALVVDGNLSIVTGSGTDEVTLNNVTAGNVSGDLTIQTGAGDDIVELSKFAAVSVSHGSLNINTGDATTLDTINILAGAPTTVSGNTAIVTGNGNDFINVQSLTTNGLAVNSGKRNDKVNLNAITSNGYFAVNLGDGKNSLTLANSTGKAVTVTGSAGADTINFDGNEFVSLTLNAGSGANVIHLKNTTISTATSITTGTGADQVFLSGVHAKSVAIDTGSGADKVSIGTTILDHLLAKLGSGDDTFIASNSTFTGQDIIDGGTGKNSIKFSKVKRPNGLGTLLGSAHL